MQYKIFIHDKLMFPVPYIPPPEFCSILSAKWNNNSMNIKLDQGGNNNPTHRVKISIVRYNN